MTLSLPGPIRLAVLSGIGGAKVKTLWLPSPSKQLPELSWEKKAIAKDLVEGSERERKLGYIPILRATWIPYDERPNKGFVIGTLDGQRPLLEDLLVILSMPSGWLKVSAGPGSAYGFVVGRVETGKLPMRGQGLLDLEVTFRGRDVVSTQSLVVF
jgi:hypothetical protein